MPTIYCRVAPSLGALEGDPNEVWGTEPYSFKHRHEPTVFFGLYDLRDYLALWLHKGKKWVLWAGSDIRNLRMGFVANDGKLKWLSQLLGSNNWVFPILKTAEHWVEDEAEAWQLKDVGVKVAGIAPSFMGDIKKYRVCFKPGNKVWASANRGREAEYGWGIILHIAWALPEIEFHLYGSTWPEMQSYPAKQGLTFRQYAPNVFIHGRVPKEKMNQQIKKMQCGLRLNKHDGFSEVTAKAILWGQYPITYLYYPQVTQYAADNHGLTDTFANLRRLWSLLSRIPKQKHPNSKAVIYYRKHLNRYPWNTHVKKHTKK